MNSNLYIIKEYHHYPGDSRNRAKTEYEALKFLSKYSIKNIPKVIGKEDKYKWLVMDYIPGKKVELELLSEDMVHQCIRFILEIQKLRHKKGVLKIKPASEAVFCLRDCYKYIDNRLNILNNIKITSNTDIECRNFITEKFFRTYHYFSNIVIKKYKKNNISESKNIGKQNYILSPSDFGFHNTLLKDNGELCFLDFEYFGWDDLAKLISDFFLQPDFPLPYIYRERVVNRLEKCIVDKDNLKIRLPVYYLLFGMKWCLILLNPFIRESYNESLKKLQLEKSKQFLDHLLKEYAAKIFPISLL